ncbi:long-chain-fatty-acid--CoA ligase 6 isoform X1 [Betta splendens]|uniref:Long-chain-fatty-acid--CoA ligase n=2 Tax=Betta splendens TaxID=158456 RepID=A0A6P7PRF5_BETSP|nr:long-chain-fatty-acid--CoA ligase 6 isoform X1 [Betta splendens]
MLAFVLVSGSLWIILELSSTLMEKMQAQEMMSGLRIPEMDDISQFFLSLPTSTLVGIGALTAVLTYWLATRPRPITPPCSLQHQSEEVPHEGGGRRSMMGDRTKLLTHYHDDARTMYEVFQRGLRISGDGPCLGSRLPNQPYKWMSYKEVTARAEHVGSGLLHQGCQPNANQFIGVFAQNRPEWIISELACYTYSMVVVPLYDTLGADAIRFIINTADITTVICDKVEKAQVLLENVEREETPGLRRIILMDAFEPALVERGRSCGVHVQAMQEVEALGREHHRHPIPPAPDDLSIVCFTSGTTGNPKGVMLSHGNVIADFAGFLKVTDKVICPNENDCLISFLPLAHMFERLIESVVYCHGGRIGFYQGDIRLLPDDMKALRPTIFPVVPRLLNRMYDKIFSQANSSWKRWLLNFAAKRKSAEVSCGIIRNDSMWDKIFFSKIQNSLGGRLRMIITGAAPTSPTVLGFLRAALGCQVYEAYGQTECTAGCTYTTPGDSTTGHVGAPLPCNLIRLVDVPEKNYFAAKGEGEVCVKGPNVFKGYLKDPERTAETLDPDGWLHTGDIGKWLPNGTLKIIDRKKHIFKLAQGEYISPEKIENIYIRSQPVAQLYVHGDSLQSCLVGIVVPDPEVMPEWAKKKGMLGTYKDLCKNTELKKAILEDLVRLGKASGLHSFEQVKNIYIHNELFSIENGLLTPTLKAKRPELKEYFKKKIDQLYSSISM